MLSTCSRSHGRALKRYGVAVSAPTGQICTVLPEKYDENGSSGNVMHLGLVAAVGEADQRVAGDLVGEAGAAVAQDAALAIEQHEVADRDRLLEVPLLLDVAALAGAVAERLVLQRALAALVADRAVERVVGEEQLDHALLGPLRRRRLGVDLHVRRHRHHARRRELRAATAVDLDEAHAGTCRPSSSGCASRTAGCTCRARSAAAITSSPLRAVTGRPSMRDGDGARASARHGSRPVLAASACHVRVPRTGTRTRDGRWS